MLRHVDNPPNPWSGNIEIEWIGPPPPATLEVFEESAGRILSRNDSPDLPFRWGLNPYRGCFHACAYCYARPSHEFLGFGAGSDFDRRIVVKTNAAELLARVFESKRWIGEAILFSGVTDCYQPLEASYRLTRACLEVCARYRNPVRLITKSALIRRDLDILADLAEHGAVHVYVSVPFARDGIGRALEPGAAAVSQRIATIRVLADAGIPVGVGVAPIIPGLTESQIPEILERAAEAGAERAFYTLLRLPGSAGAVFEKRIRAAVPLRADRILRALDEMRGGRRDDARFGSRMRGQGLRWMAIENLFRLQCRRLGLELSADRGPEDLDLLQTPFRRPGQLDLFG